MIQLFQRCHGRVISRHTIESIGQQLDPTRRKRDAAASLEAIGYEVLCGYLDKEKERIRQLGFEGPMLSRSEYICLKSDGTTFDDYEAREERRRIEATAFRAEYKKRVRTEKGARKKVRDETLARMGDAVQDVANLEATDEYAPYGPKLVRDVEAVAEEQASAAE